MAYVVILHARRTVARVDDKIHFRADFQVGDRNVLITPTSPALTDPFLLLARSRLPSIRHVPRSQARK